MDEPVLTSQARQRLGQIHALSSRLNALEGRAHRQRLMELVRHHVQEIDELAQGQDPHHIVETGDLLILCFELLLESGADIDAVAHRCFERYDKKLTGLIQQHRRDMDEGSV